MAKRLNPKYIRHIMAKDEIRGFEAVVLTGFMFGLSDGFHWAQDDLEDEYPEFDKEEYNRDLELHKAAFYKGWSSTCKLYCKKCRASLEGITREIVNRNWCDSCKVPLYPDDDKSLDARGYDIYRDKVLRYTSLAVKHMRESIEGAGQILPSGSMVNGFHKDHLLSIRDGFEREISELVIASPPNLRVVRERENLSKGRKSGCCPEQLLARYARFLEMFPSWIEVIKQSDESEDLYLYPI